MGAEVLLPLPDTRGAGMRMTDRYMCMELGVCQDRQQIHAKHTTEDLSVSLTLLLFCIRGEVHMPLAYFLAKDASYGNAEAKKKTWERSTERRNR